jgi:endogenous inhibitor of DNA gyrase (YacG/DUF329 family)
MITCKIDNTEHLDYKHLSRYIKKNYNITSQEYYDKYIGKTFCKNCGKKTSWKNINIGYRDFCSVKCLNRYKVNDPVFLKKLSDSQVGIPRKKHSESTKEKCRQIMLDEWKNNREERLRIIQSDEVRSKISKSVSNLDNKRNIEFYNGIRYESKAELKFIKKCLSENISIKRFNEFGKKSIPLSNKRWSVPDFQLDNVIVEVKDFHIWFCEEILDGLIKYKEINEWCIKHELIFIFWFPNHGYKTISDFDNLNTIKDIRKYERDNKSRKKARQYN